MALSNKQKAGIGIGVGALLLLGAAGAANADDTPTDDDDGGGDLPPPPPGPCPPGQVRIGDVCVVPPPPPDPKKCNYSGCGPQFDNNHPSPVTLAIRLQQLGYPINPTAPGWSQIQATSMAIWREFQEDYNHVRAGNGLAGPAALRAAAGAPAALAAIKAGPKLATDGLVGNNTIAALNRATALVPAINLSWDNCVRLA